MSLFSPRPTTVEQAVKPLRSMIEDLEEISETCERRTARNMIEIEDLRIQNQCMEREQTRAATVTKTIRELIGD